MDAEGRLAMPLRNELRLDAHNDLVLTYDNTKQTDGVGAQPQRIYGIYSISRFLGVSYLHSPLCRVDYQGLSALENNVADPGFHHPFNELFHINSDVTSTDDFHKIKMPRVSIEMIHNLVDTPYTDKTGRKPTLVQIAYPYGIADSFPDCYEVCKEISPFASSACEGRPLRVAIHVRRGEQVALKSDRMLENAYYISVAQNVADSLNALKLDFQMELHTEFPDKEFIVQPDHHGILNRIGAPTPVTPEMNRLDEFRVLPNLVPCINETAIDCLGKFATADILIMSRSSFSYVGAILNRSGIILYHPFWHRPPSSWLTVGPDGQFDQLKFMKAVKALPG